jgi:hypothetical protein
MIADLGIDGDGAVDLWTTAGEQFRARTFGSQISPDCVDPTMMGVSSMGVKLIGGSHRGH